jgi:hypothetical protein
MNNMVSLVRKCEEDVREVPPSTGSVGNRFTRFLFNPLSRFEAVFLMSAFAASHVFCSKYLRR